MAERQITVDGVTRPLEEPFLVIATQNPLETLGTFPLPEAQMDRFLMKLSMEALSPAEETQMIARFLTEEPLAELSSVCQKEEICALQEACKEVYLHPELVQYLVRIVQETRVNSKIASGVSPRGTLAFLRCRTGPRGWCRDETTLCRRTSRPWLFRYSHTVSPCRSAQTTEEPQNR